MAWKHVSAAPKASAQAYPARDAGEAGARGPGRQAGLVDQRKRKIPSGYRIIMGFNSDFMGLNSDFMGFNGSLWWFYGI